MLREVKEVLWIELYSSKRNVQTLTLYTYECEFIYLFICLFFLRWSLALLPRLEFTGLISDHYNLRLLGASDSPASASRVAGIIGVPHYTRLIFVFLVEMGFHHVGQIGHKLLTSDDLPSSTSRSLGL